MLHIVLVGLGAGVAAALLIASVTFGTFISVPLFYIAPLPIMIAGLGWSHWSALIAAVLASTAAGFIASPTLFLTFLIGVGIPAWWLSYLVLLARPGETSLEWYPTGRIVVWAAFLSAFFVMGVLTVSYGIDFDGYRAGMTAILTPVVQMFVGASPDLAGTSVDKLVAFLVASTPPTAAVIATIASLVNIWLAARVVRVSGLLKRPWPDLSAIAFPKLLLAALAAALILNFAGGMIGVIAVVLSSTLLLAFAVLGLAVLHTATRGFSARPLMLGGVYASVPLLQGLPMLALGVLGISETAFDLRARAARKRAPPPRL